MTGDILQAEHFEPHVGKLVRFRGTRHAFPLKEVVTDDRPVPPGMRRPFLLIFCGPREQDVMPAGIYECELEGGPVHRLYVNPIHTPAHDRQDYQAAFN